LHDAPICVITYGGALATSGRLVSGVNLTRLSDAFDIVATNDDDWFDLTIEVDSNFGVDPFLIYQDDSSRWNTAHDHILKFFAVVFDCVRRARRDKNSLYWKIAEQLLLFREPAEFCLGVSAKTPFGAGAGEGLQKDMLESISVALVHGKDSIPHMEYIDVLAGGLGLDRISDMTCNILKSYFIKYTQGVCRRHDIPMTKVLVHNADWSADNYEWVSKRVELPINPAYAKLRLPILLTPEAFIRDIPVANADGFMNYASAAADLRRRFNINLSRYVPRHLKAQVARANFDLIDQYFAKLEDRRWDAYPLEDDPHRRLNPGQTGTALLSEYPAATIPTTQSQVPSFVAALVKNFAYCIEQKGIWRSLWYKNRGLPEANVQRLFYLTAINFCRQNNILVTPESSAGRGPVDFVFGKKWKDRALVELKLVRNSAFWDGIMKQVPAYTRAEEIHAAFFVGVAYTDEEMAAASREKVEKAAALASEKNGITITPLIIDARRKVSASKERMTPAERAELRAAQEQNAGQ
jgi:hypothetical protein